MRLNKKACLFGYLFKLRFEYKNSTRRIIKNKIPAWKRLLKPNARNRRRPVINIDASKPRLLFANMKVKSPNKEVNIIKNKNRGKPTSTPIMSIFPPGLKKIRNKNRGIRLIKNK
jgi:hypothetical protein